MLTSQRGKLLTHSADSESELELLHPADRLMVRLIQVPHLADRVKGMLFQVRFAQNVELLQQSLDLLIVACHDLRGARKFQQLMNVILTMGNYLNGTNFAGGAYGFKIGSINKLVDTKSSNGQNLLHFLERTVSTHFPELEGFLQELEKPSDASRVNFSDMQATSKQMLDEIRSIRQSLESNFETDKDGYTRKMFRFSAAAEDDMQTLRDGIINAEKGLRDVETYYGEGEEHGRRLQSQEFFGIFRTFTSSYKFCRQANRARQEEVALRERRAAARAALTPQPTGASTSSENNLIDARLQRLKLEGTPRIKRERRQPAPPPSPLPANTDFSDFMLPNMGSQDVDFGSLAQKMMMNIFESPAPNGAKSPDGADDISLPVTPSPMPSGFKSPESIPSILGGDFNDEPHDGASTRPHSGTPDYFHLSPEESSPADGRDGTFSDIADDSPYSPSKSSNHAEETDDDLEADLQSHLEAISELSAGSEYHHEDDDDAGEHDTTIVFQPHHDEH